MKENRFGFFAGQHKIVNERHLPYLIKVLYLEDSPQDIEILQELLIASDFEPELDCTNSEKEFVNLITNNKYDVILSDFILPGFDGFSALKKSLEICPNVPFILVSGSIGEEKAIELLKEGATDFILKDRMARLPKAIKNAIESRMLQKALRDSEEKFRAIALYSPDHIIMHDEKLRYTFVLNPQLDLTVQEMLGKTDFDLLHRDEAEKLTRIKTQVMESGIPFHLETSLHSQHKEEEFFNGSFIPKLDETGKVNGLIGYFSNVTEQKKQEQQTRISNGKFTSLFNNVTQGVALHKVIYDSNEKAIDYIIENVNQAFEQIIGIRFKDVEGRKASEIYGTGEAPYLDVYSRVAESGKSERFETIFNPMQKCFSISVSSPEKGYFTTIFEDITRRIQEAALLAETSDRLKEVLENAIDASYKRNLLTNKYEYLSPAFEKISGYTADELNDLPIKEVLKLMHPDDISETKKTIAKAMSEFSDNSFEVIYRFKHKKNGDYRWILDKFTIMRNNQDMPVAMIGSVSDITHRKSAEEALKKSEEKFKAIANYSASWEAWFNNDGRLIWANSYCEKITGYTAEEYLAADNFIEMAILEPDLHIAQTTLITALSGNSGENLEIRCKHKNGGAVWISVSWVPIFDSEGNNIGVRTSASDISEQKKAEQKIIEALEHARKSDRLKSAFLANMSHEIRTPMSGILGFAGILKEPKLSGEEQQEYIRIIEESGNRMLNIISDIVNISKIESGTMDVHISETNINELTALVANLLIHDAVNKNLTLTYHNAFPDKASYVLTDSDKFLSILSNLVKNAIKYTARGSIEFGYALKTDTEPNELEFYVKDSGPGIPKHMQEAIFERFIQADNRDKTARQGAGLGLAISRAYVAMLGGKVWVESEEGNGSTFYFTIPYTVEPEQKIITKTGAAAETQIVGKKLKILIAEDDDTLSLLISLYVKDFCKEILTATTGNEAIEMCRANPDVDLILMDIQMPDLNGYKATRQIRKFNKEVVIIAQTAYGQIGDREKAIESGCNDYIAKPIKKDELVALIKKYFEK